MLVNSVDARFFISYKPYLVREIPRFLFWRIINVSTGVSQVVYRMLKSTVHR